MYSQPYNSKRQAVGLGFNTEMFTEIVSVSGKAIASTASAIKGNGGGSSAPKAQASAQPAGEGFLSSLSNTELAIGGIAGVALLMNVMR
jgi:hypothetical protein